VWKGESPQLQVTLAPDTPVTEASQTKVGLAVRAVDRRGESRNANSVIRVPPVELDGAGKRVTRTFPLPPMTPGVPFWWTDYKAGSKVDKIPTEYVLVNVSGAEHGLHSEEYIYPIKGSLAHSCSVHLEGDFESRKASVSFYFGPHGQGVDQKVDIEFHVLDIEGNELSGGEEEIWLSNDKPTVYEKDVTPDRNSTGPYAIAFTLNSEALGMAVAAEARFPFSTSLIPVTSMESDTMADWHIPGRSLDSGAERKLPNVLFSHSQPFARPVFDEEVKRSGARSLRIDYADGQPVTIGSSIRLPGLPQAARIWVKGNNTRDRLVLEWRDPCKFGAPAHQRWMNSMAVTICTLDFSDWRRFTVPVMGSGLLGRDTASFMRGHSGQEVEHPVQAPLYVGALRVIPARPKKGDELGPADRSVWIDDILVETQAPLKERMSLELRGDTVARRLHAEARIFVTVGNGTGHDIRNGRVTVTFLDGDERPVEGLELTEAIDVPTGEVATRAIALGSIAQARLRGPVTALVTVAGPVAGQRVKGRIVFSAPSGTGLLWSFEKREHFNPPAPKWHRKSRYHRGMLARQNGQTYICLTDNTRSWISDRKIWRPLPAEQVGAAPVPGGADGSAHALPLRVTTNLPVSVLLHPALPGIVAGVEMQVFGTGKPVQLTPVFVDSGSPDFNLPFQQFAAEPVRVDWKGWKPCRFAAPPIPPGYATGRSNPMYAPVYPLNLVLTASTEDGLPAEIRVDQIKVTTHVPESEALSVRVAYPDETLMQIPGAPLRLELGSLAATPMNMDLAYRLTTPVGSLAAEGTRTVALAPGAHETVELVEALREGFYHLHVSGLPGDRVFEADVQAPDRARFFGDDIMSRLADFRELQRDLGLNERRLNLDWDTAEPVPNLPHHDWFRRYRASASEAESYEPVPLVGFAADWAGPEKQESVEAGTYIRTVGNYMQTPVRMVDWDAFMRNVGREHAREFKKWVFWQGPDKEELPTYLSPPKYRSMLAIFDRWISLYNPEATVVAGGFQFDRALNYLEEMQEPASLSFDQFEVQVNPGSLSVEDIQMEDFLGDLDAILDLRETGRNVAITGLDWVTDERFGLLDHAAYHARAAVLLHVAGAPPHQFKSVDRRETRDGFGLLFRPPYGNSSIQKQRAFHVPKPAYFGLIETRRMLSDLELIRAVGISDRDPQANRAYLFKQKKGGVCAAVWRVRGARRYGLPPGWEKVKALDAFGVPVALDNALPVGSMPLFLYFGSETADRVAFELRNLRWVEPDGSHEPILELVADEAYSREAAEYKFTGGERVQSTSARLPAGERVRAGFMADVTKEQFVFELEEPGDVLLSRLWLLSRPDETNRTVEIMLNQGPVQTWDLAPRGMLAMSNVVAEAYAPGPRRSTFVLRGCKAGRNTVSLRHRTASSAGGFRLTRITDGRVELTACGVLGRLDAGVPAKVFRNSAGAPLALGRQTYDVGVGCMGQTWLEYPLNKQFSRFTVTVGVDAMARGRGSVGFRVLVDGIEKARSGPMTGMTLAKKLEVKGLKDGERLLLMVDDGGDGSENDLGNWIEPVLYLEDGE
jgi:hypothetical protein